MNFVNLVRALFESKSPVVDPNKQEVDPNRQEVADDTVPIPKNQAGHRETTAEVTDDKIGVSVTVCSICYDTQGVTVVDVCPNEGCQFCVTCFQSYVKMTVEKAWACPELKCPGGCKQRVATAAWQAHAAASEVAVYNHRLKHMVGVRCPSCHAPNSLFIDTVPQEGERVAAKAALVDAKAEEESKRGRENEQEWAGAEQQQQRVELEEGLRRYAAGKMAPRAMVDCLVSHVGGQVEALAALASPALWCALAGDDAERRTSLQLAWYRVSPKVATPCCARTMCFKCQTRDWHEGKTCAQMEERVSLDTMLCPACDVAIVRSEGCSHMLCPCGHAFTWDPAKQRAEREAAAAARRAEEEARRAEAAAAEAEAALLRRAACLAHMMRSVRERQPEPRHPQQQGEGEGKSGGGGGDGDDTLTAQDAAAAAAAKDGEEGAVVPGHQPQQQQGLLERLRGAEERARESEGVYEYASFARLALPVGLLFYEEEEEAEAAAAAA